ncbi:phage major capsid protein [Methylobacterium sp. NEAU 140]|uniref:phage major capsid protein n=1 Tax=Methylobacterium sp. NEAU 140 TaxID=3064945 RepID=UPI002736FDAC|nr:phage major capsid protein [Methylobacterium sp. NEAU 140]MDP4022339.1 phage major capsid protein [Methylobacterium sp. NEAU 140]
MNMHTPGGLTAAHVAYGREYGRKDAGGQGSEPGTFREIMTALDARDKEIQAFATKADAEIKAHGRILDDTKGALDKVLSESGALAARLLELEQKAARRPGDGAAQKSVGERFTDHDDFKALAHKGRGVARMELKAVTAITSGTTGTGAAGAAIRPDRLPGILVPAERPLTIRDLLSPGRTSSNAIEYVRETGFQNNAAPVAEGVRKPQSDLSLGTATANVRCLAHWFKASRQVLDDVPALQSYIDARATYGLLFVEEQQLLAGDGTGQNLLGLLPQATSFSGALRKSGDTKIDTIRRAILQVRVAEFRASGIVMSPGDWADIELMKDTTGGYIWSNPAINNGQNLWGLPVVDTNSMAADHFMVGAFNIAAQVFDRQQAVVEVSTENEDDFVKNLVTIRAEERLTLAVFRPESFVHGTFTP